MIALVVTTLVLLAAFVVGLARALSNLRNRFGHPLAEANERIVEVPR